MSVRRSPFFISAVLFLGLAVSVRFDNQASGVVWLWADQPRVSLVLLGVSAVMWALFVRRTMSAPSQP